MGVQGIMQRLAAPDPMRVRVDDIDSIIEHLRGLLSTRQGEAPTVPDFGVIDFTDLGYNFPEAIQVLQRSIRATILQYKPRLKSVVRMARRRTGSTRRSVREDMRMAGAAAGA